MEENNKKRLTTHEEEIKYMKTLLKEHENEAGATKINYVVDVMNEEGEIIKTDSFPLDKGLLELLVREDITVIESLTRAVKFIKENEEETGERSVEEA